MSAAHDPPGTADTARQRLIQVSQPADVGEARRQGLAVAMLLGFDTELAGRVALAITEAGTNIVKHAREGAIVITPLDRWGASTIEVIALDRGEGIADLALSMRDGYSTAGTYGGGMGALGRLTSRLEVFSLPGKGTAIRFEVGRGASPPPRGRYVTAGAVCVPKPGETACGDGWTLIEEESRCTLLVVDGLGHGVDAAAAAHCALELARRHGAGASALELIQRLHAGLKPTRGAAGAVAVLDLTQGTGRFCGVGNIACAVRFQHTTRKLASQNGILGHQSRSLQAYPFSYPTQAALILHSDGLNTHWRLDDYAGLERFHPALVAGVLYRDHARGNDDATCVVVRNDGERA